MTFAQLQARVEDYLNRSDVDSLIDDWIVEAQRDVERGIFIIDGEKVVHNFDHMNKRQTFSTDDTYITFPSRIKEIKWLKILLDGRYYDLNQADSSWALSKYPYPSTAEKRPRLYSIMPSQSEIMLRPSADQCYTYDINFYAYTDDLSEDADENWWTQYAWEVLLFGALRRAQPYLMNDPRLAVWDAEYLRAVKKIVEVQKQAKQSGSYLVIDSNMPCQLTGGAGFDIDVI